MNSVRVSLGHCAQFWESFLWGGGMYRTQESLSFLNGAHFQKRNQEVVPKTCAEDLKTDVSSQDCT